MSSTRVGWETRQREAGNHREQLVGNEDVDSRVGIDPLIQAMGV